MSQQGSISLSCFSAEFNRFQLCLRDVQHILVVSQQSSIDLSCVSVGFNRSLFGLSLVLAWSQLGLNFGSAWAQLRLRIVSVLAQSSVIAQLGLSLDLARSQF